MSEDKRGAVRRVEPANSLSRQIFAHVEEQITAGALGPGDRLPTEHAMMEAFGVSRSVVREAVSALRADGLVVTRQGSGAFVAQGVQLRPFRISPESLESLEDVLELLEFRLCLEPAMAELAAERRSEAQLAELDAALHSFADGLTSGSGSIAADQRFHLCVAEAAGNSHFSGVLRGLGRNLVPRQSVRIRIADGTGLRSYLERVHEEHIGIADALRARDCTAARERVRQHLEHTRERYRMIAAKVRDADVLADRGPV